MRFDLSEDIAHGRAAAIKKISATAREAHTAHEDAGGHSFEGALASKADASSSLNYHIAVQAARMQAITSIKAAPHGNAITKIMAEFMDSLASLKNAG